MVKEGVLRRVWTEAWVYACVDGCARLALRSRPEAPVPGRVCAPLRGGALLGTDKEACVKNTPPAVNCCFRTGTDQGNPTVESKHSIAIATQGFDAM